MDKTAEAKQLLARINKLIDQSGLPISDISINVAEGHGGITMETTHDGTTIFLTVTDITEAAKMAH